MTGDVIDLGLVKLSLMELGGNGNDRQPTGRVVVFSNAIVFQPSGNFFKQIPGTNFVWNEVTLTLSPDCDYRLAEKRLLEAVEEVFARYREASSVSTSRLERSLNMADRFAQAAIALQLSARRLAHHDSLPGRDAQRGADCRRSRAPPARCDRARAGTEAGRSIIANIQPARRRRKSQSEAEAGNGTSRRGQTREVIKCSGRPPDR